jgi:hypothetical protein
MMNRVIKVLGILVLLAAFSAPASAAPLTIHSDTGSSTEGLGTFTGLFAYNPATATLSVTINPTSPTGGYLTGIAFLNPGGITGVTYSSTDADFALIGGPTFSGGVDASPFDQFDIGAALGGSWLGGGSPTVGTPSGGSVTFTFAFLGTGLASLTEMDFVQAASAASGDEWLVARFRGFPGGGSDKVPADFITSVPEPATVLLLGMGGIAALVRRRRQAR